MNRAEAVSRNGRPDTAKEQAFARAYVENAGNASEAYRSAYNASGMSDNAVAVEAHRVLKRPNVSLIVAQLQDEAAKRFELTHDGVIRMLFEDRIKARELGQMASAVRADELIGKHLGMFADRRKNTGHIRMEELVVQLEGLTLEELRALSRGDGPEALREGRSAELTTGREPQGEV
jgi:hypothetical protein